MSRTFRLRVFSMVLAVTASALGQADDATIRVESAWVRQAAMIKGGDAKAGSGNGAVYAMLVNSGKETDALVAAASDAAGTVEIHESYRDMGMIMMRPVKKIDVPAGKSVEMKPGGYHIMLLNLKRDLKVGESIRVTLQFQKAGKIPVIATIR